MTYGFFTPTELKTKKTLKRSSQCGACGLYKHCQSPQMTYKGEGRKKILVVGESPGAEEDRNNEQFVGKAGKRLKSELRRVGINLNKDCWKTNIRRCYVEGNIPPTIEQIQNCRPALFKEVRELKPKAIWLFGATAAEGVLGHLWKTNGKCSLTKWTDWTIPHQELNAWISVHYHPSYLNRNSTDKLLHLIAHQQLKKAAAKLNRPWKKTPNFANEVQVVYDYIKIVRLLAKLKSPCAFDFETNCVKPEYEGAEIVSCAFSDGESTFAFPWNNQVAKIVKGVLQAKTHKKIGCNIKYEERWTRHFLDTSVKGWLWDTMLAAHILNNAKGTTSLKFQSFVKLGQPPYNMHIEPYLETGRNQHINRIRELPIEDVLLYNGLDALLSYKLAKIQKEIMKNVGSRRST